jgi:hypothetical protein
MPDHDLPPAAEAFLLRWTPTDTEMCNMRADLAALLESVRAAEREGCARLLEADAARRAGADPAASSAWEELVAEELRELAGRVRQGERPAPGWVRTAEALPAEGVPVLVWIVPDDATPAYCFIATRRGSEWEDPEGIEVGEWVRAWRSLPAGPEEGGEEG